MALFTTSELESWLQLSSSTIDSTLGDLLHDQAVGYLEGELGVVLESNSGVTVDYYPRWDDIYIDLPVPTTAVTSVSIDGTAAESDDYQFLADQHRLYRRPGWGGSRWTSDNRFAWRTSDDDYASVSVTMTYGYATAPKELKTWGLILASQAYQLQPNLNQQSVRLDDYAATYATGGDLVATGMGLPPKVLGRLKSRYGRRNAQVVESR